MQQLTGQQQRHNGARGRQHGAEPSQPGRPRRLSANLDSFPSKPKRLALALEPELEQRHPTCTLLFWRPTCTVYQTGGKRGLVEPCEYLNLRSIFHA